MIELFDYGFMQRGIIGGLIIAGICGVLGVFLVLKKMSLFGDSLSHASFAGISIGFLFGFQPTLTAIIVSGLAAVGIDELVKKMKGASDAATSVILSISLGISILILSYLKGFNADLFSYLFGSILTVSNEDLIVIFFAASGIMLFYWRFYKELAFTAFNEEIAKTSGIDTELINKLFVVISAITIVIAIKAVGILLVSSLIVLPAISALSIAKSLRATILISSLIGCFSVVFGTILSFYTNLAASGVIVILLFCIFLISLKIKKVFRN